MRESSRIEDLVLPKDLVREPWETNACLHLLAYRDCIEHAQGGAPLRESDIKRWQGAITKEQLDYGFRIAEDEIGEYRCDRMTIGLRECPQPILIPGLMTELVADINTFALREDESAEAISDFAARAHLRYEHIHPFADGNGRSGRLLALWILVRHDAPLVVFTADDRRTAYYPCFKDASGSEMTEYFRAHRVAPDRLL